MDKYNKLCNKYFKTDINNNYNVQFYSDNDDQHYIILKTRTNKIWCTYKILASYDISKNYFKKGTEMIIINKKYIDDSIKLNNIKSIEDIYNSIYDKCINNNYIGFITKRKENIIFFILIDKIKSIYNN